MIVLYASYLMVLADAYLEHLGSRSRIRQIHPWALSISSEVLPFTDFPDAG